MLFDDRYVALPLNLRGRDFVVGDLHGQHEMLLRGLDLVNFDSSTDRLVALGDLVDRGFGSVALLKMLEAQPWFYSVVGNHEAMMLGSQDNREILKTWDVNDNDWAYEVEPGQLEECCRIADGLPMVIELSTRDGRKVGLIHAEVRVGCTWADMRGMSLHGNDAINNQSTTDSAAAIWGRRRVTAEATMRYNRRAKKIDPGQMSRLWKAAQPVEGIDLVMAGHTILVPPLPRQISNMLFVDTGAYKKDGRLTLVEVHEQLYWQVGRSRRGFRALRRNGRPLPKSLVPPRAYAKDADVG